MSVAIVDGGERRCDHGRVITQNVFPVRLLAKPSRAQQRVRANAEAAFQSRRRARHQAGHEAADFLLRLSLMDSGWRAQLRDTPSPFV
jgi:hypothetical protein